MTVMADASAHIHPRKLYELLRACPSAETRAKAAFQFLAGASGSGHACLFLAGGADLVLVESSPGSAQVPGLAQEAIRALHAEQDMKVEDDRTKTVDIRMLEAIPETPLSTIWHSHSGVAFDRSALSFYRDGRWATVGVFMFKPAELAAAKSIRRAHIEALCNAFVDSGDVVVARATLVP
jgi:hypothetical protein